ncbi:hypothetical protein E2320_016573, partial [Naja naja]
VYPPLREQFSSFNKESQSGLKIKGMAKLGSELMLCQADDLDLIKGKASVKKQLHFLQQLVAVIPAPTNVLLSDSISDSSSYSSTEESFQEIARKNEEFIKQVFSSPDLQAVLNPECHPWNPDIKPLLLGEERQQKRAVRSMTSHEQTLLEASEELEKTAAALENLRAQGNPAGADLSNNTATALQSLKLIVSDYSQLLTAFEQVYKNELQKHCERPAPKQSPCDPLFQAELQGLAQITVTAECIMAMVQRWHEQKVFWNGSTIATLPSCGIGFYLSPFKTTHQLHLLDYLIWHSIFQEKTRYNSTNSRKEGMDLNLKYGASTHPINRKSIDAAIFRARKKAIQGQEELAGILTLHLSLKSCLPFFSEPEVLLLLALM